VGIIETVPNAIIIGPAVQVRNTALTVGLIAVLFGRGAGALIARSLTRPIVQLTKAVESIAAAAPRQFRSRRPGRPACWPAPSPGLIAESTDKTVALEREVASTRRTEAALVHHAERERLFSAAVESSNDAIITMSLDGTVTGWNTAAERLYGLHRGRSRRQQTSPSSFRRTGVGSAGHPAADRLGRKIEHNETIRRRKDGSLVEVSLSSRRSGRRRARPSAFPRWARDNHRTNRTRLALRQQTEERRRIFETSQDLILVMNSRGYLVQISPSCQTILGYRPDEMIGRSGEEFIHPDDLENSRREMQAARRGLPTRISDTRVFHKDGRAVRLSWLGTWSEPVKRFFFVGRDMTETLRAQQTLRESEQLRANHRNRAGRVCADG